MSGVDADTPGAISTLSTLLGLVSALWPMEGWAASAIGYFGTAVGSWGALFSSDTSYLIVSKNHDDHGEYSPDMTGHLIVCTNIPQVGGTSYTVTAYNMDPSKRTLKEGDEYVIPDDIDWGDPGDHSGPNGDEPDIPTPEEWSERLPNLPYPGTANSKPISLERFIYSVYEEAFFLN